MHKDRALAGWWAWLAAGLALSVLVAVLLLWGRPLYEFVADRERIHAWVMRFGAWGPVAIGTLEMLQAVLAPIPGQAIEAVSGYLFGPWLGALYAMAGIAIGSLLNFALARRLGRPLLVRLTSAERVARLDDLARRGGTLFFFLLWLFPFVPDDLACLAAGLTPMTLRQFLFLMLIGRLPGILASTWLGANAVHISPAWWGGLIAALALAALGLWRWGERVQATMLRFLQVLAERLER
ncbi:MAG: TVP38/TMEM64 family protein [Anaerolineae bacterium]